MRVVHATALTAAALLLASVASAQGLGDAAAREREKRKAAPPAKPAKVYTEGDIGSSMAPASGADQPAAPADATAGSPPATGEGKTAGDAAKSAGQTEDEAKAAAQAAWRQQLDGARKEEAFYRDLVDKTQLQLNDTSGMYSPAYTAAMASLEENKKKLADAQAKIATLEEEGRRKLYR